VAGLVKDNHLRSLPRAMDAACSADTARSSDADARERGGGGGGGGGGYPREPICVAHFISTSRARHDMDEGDVSEVQWARLVNGISAPSLDAVRGRATVINEGCELENAWQVGVSDRSVCVRARVPVERLGDDPIMKSEQHITVRMSVQTKVFCCFFFVCVFVTIFIVRQMSGVPAAAPAKKHE